MPATPGARNQSGTKWGAWLLVIGLVLLVLACIGWVGIQGVTWYINRPLPPTPTTVPTATPVPPTPTPEIACQVRDATGRAIVGAPEGVDVVPPGTTWTTPDGQWQFTCQPNGYVLPVQLKVPVFTPTPTPPRRTCDSGRFPTVFQGQLGQVAPGLMVQENGVWHRCDPSFGTPDGWVIADVGPVGYCQGPPPKGGGGWWAPPGIQFPTGRSGYFFTCDGAGNWIDPAP